MTKKGIKKYRRDNPGSKLKGAVTGTVKKGSKAAKRRKSYCATSSESRGLQGGLVFGGSVRRNDVTCIPKGTSM